MLFSMTGFGRVSKSLHNKNFTIEIRSLNSKFTDIRIKTPQVYREKEHEIRRILSDRLERGKIEFTLDIQDMQADDAPAINGPLFRKYYQEIKALMDELTIAPGDIVQSVLQLPDVVANVRGAVSEEEWTVVQQLMGDAIAAFEQFRQVEGAVIEKDMLHRIAIIREKLLEVAPFETERVDKLRQKIYQNLEEYLGKDKVDENRFEQEILFYLEKIDISEEKLRLGQHCQYYLDELGLNASQKGRKLAFIAQEIGREINTLGAKAYSSEIQKRVVVMKDELEKIKEQIANCL
ncbi:MAG: YicC/YloC family endoribonuclease [Haliscomenobacter sp.]